MNKTVSPILLMAAIPVSAIVLLIYRLETYGVSVHNNSAGIICEYCLVLFFLSIFIRRKAKDSSKWISHLWAVSMVVLLLVAWVGTKIPYCVVCEQLTAEDLGLLAHWIKPELISH